MTNKTQMTSMVKGDSVAYIVGDVQVAEMIGYQTPSGKWFDCLIIDDEAVALKNDFDSNDDIYKFIAKFILNKEEESRKNEFSISMENVAKNHENLKKIDSSEIPNVIEELDKLKKFIQQENNSEITLEQTIEDFFKGKSIELKEIVTNHLHCYNVNFERENSYVFSRSVAEIEHLTLIIGLINS